MAKIYCIKQYRRLKELKLLREELVDRIDYCNKSGYLYLDNYLIKDIKQKIEKLLAEIENENKKSS